MKRLLLRSAILFAAFILPFCLCGAAEAQIAAYGGFSGAAVSGGSTPSAWGGLVGVYAQKRHFIVVSAGGDLRASFLKRNGFHYNTGAIGPRLAFRIPIVPLRPYVEGLVGVAHYNVGAGSSNGTRLNYHAVAGLDWTVMPRVDWRVFDYDFSGTTGSVSANIFSMGISIRVW